MENTLNYDVIDNEVVLTKGEERITLDDQELLAVLIFAIESFTDENSDIKVATGEDVLNKIEAYTGYKLIKE